MRGLMLRNPKNIASFIFEVITNNVGESSNFQFEVPINPSFTYNYQIKTSDGQIFKNLTDSYTITFPIEGTYNIEITGDFPSIYFNNSGDKDKITDIIQWGLIEWESFENSFNGCSNLGVMSFKDTPNLTNTTSMRNAFYNAINFNSYLDNWDMSNIVNMEGMLYNNLSFKQDISSWDISNVTNLNNFLTNGDINEEGTLDNYNNLLIGWNQTLENAYPGGVGYTPLITADFGNSKYIVDITTFDSRESLTNIYNWNIIDDYAFILEFKTDNIGTSTDTQFTIPTNPSLTYDYDVVTSDGQIFENVTGDLTITFDNVGTYDVYISRNFPAIYFNNTGDKDKLLDVKQWGNVPFESLERAFYGCSNLQNSATDLITDGGINNINLAWRGCSGLTNAPEINHLINCLGLSNTWEGCSSLITAPDISNLINVGTLFSAWKSCSNLTTAPDVSNLVNVTTLSNTWDGCSSLLIAPDISNLVNANSLSFSWRGCSSLTTAPDISNLVNVNNIAAAWINCSNLTTVLPNQFDNFIVSNYASIYTNTNLTQQSIDNVLVSIDASGVTNGTFDQSGGEAPSPVGITSRNNLVAKGWTLTTTANPNFIIRVKTDNTGISNNDQVTLPLTGTYDIEYDGQVLTNQTDTITLNFPSGSGEYDISISPGLTRIAFASGGDKDKLLDVKNWGDILWLSMDGAFQDCDSLTVISASDSPDLSNLTSLNNMFRQCSNLTSVNVSNWDVSNVTTMAQLLFGTNIQTFDISNWDVSNVSIFTNAFGGGKGLNLAIQNWDISSAITFASAFIVNNLLDRDLSGWDITGVGNFSNFMSGATGLSTANYDTTLIGWEATLQAAFPNGVGYTPTISIDFGGSQYTWEGRAARESLINTFGWTITDGGELEQPEFVITVKTDNVGTSNNDQVILPLTGTYDIDWGDGVAQTLTGAQTYTYESPGEYNISISPGLTQIQFVFADDYRKIIDIKNWGNISWQSMFRAFAGCNNISEIRATDTPDLSNVTDVSGMFRNMRSNLIFNNLQDWDVSNVQNFSNMFLLLAGSTSINIENWDMSSATNISSMLQSCSNTDLNLENWNIVNVTNASNFMIGHVGFSTANYEATLIGWHATLQAAFPGGLGWAGFNNINFGGSQYTLGSAAETARTSLINNFGWTITDGGGI